MAGRSFGWPPVKKYKQCILYVLYQLINFLLNIIIGIVECIIIIINNNNNIEKNHQ
jgi:hypothetical protein